MSKNKRTLCVIGNSFIETGLRPYTTLNSTEEILSSVTGLDDVYSLVPHAFIFNNHLKKGFILNNHLKKGSILE